VHAVHDAAAPPAEKVLAAHVWHAPEVRNLPAAHDETAVATHADEEVEPCGEV